MITVDELKVALRVTNDAENTYIASLEAAAIATLERDTGIYYGDPKTVTEVATAAPVIWLLSTPTAITAFEAYEGDAWTAVTDYERTDRRIVLRETWRYPTDLRITYTTGYTDETVPADIRLKVIQLVTLWFERRLPEADVMAMQQAVIGFHPSV